MQQICVSLYYILNIWIKYAKTKKLGQPFIFIKSIPLPELV